MAAFYYYFIIRYFVFGRFPFCSGDLFTWDRKAKGGTKRKGDDEKTEFALGGGEKKNDEAKWPKGRLLAERVMVVIV